MLVYIDLAEQGVSHRKRPPHAILDNSIQSSQQVVQLEQIVTELHENQQTLQEKFERMEKMLFMMQGGMQGGMQGWMGGGMQGEGGAKTSGGA
ncbi:hypothetical protein SLA2020_353640 [Shorea laevis]